MTQKERVKSYLQSVGSASSRDLEIWALNKAGMLAESAKRHARELVRLEDGFESHQAEGGNWQVYEYNRLAERPKRPEAGQVKERISAHPASCKPDYDDKGQGVLL